MKGVLLVNLGSPKSTSVKDVRTYLRQFLMDERVIDKPYLLRKFIVECFILPTRPKRSAEAYQSIWWEEGSPLIVISKQQKEKIQKKVKLPIAIAMRYAEPSIENGIQELVNQGVDDIFMIPLYPQYAMSSTETVNVEAERIRAKKFPSLKITSFPAFYKDEDYIQAFTDHVKNYLPAQYDGILFSYHGLPERHIYKTDDFGQCKIGGCCQRKDSPSHAKCYRHQCFEVTRQTTELLNLDQNKVHQSFQSRLLKDPWLKPYTDLVLEELPKKGVKKLVVIAPAFISDCLETLEEIAQEGKKEFIKAGGEEFTYIPCLNDSDLMIDVLEKWINKFEKMNSKLGAWLLAARLRTLPLSLSGILMGTFLALHQEKFDWKIFLLSCLTTILYQILSNFANDYGDGVKGTDENRIGPKRALQAGLLTTSQLKNGLIITGILSFLVTILLLYVSFIPQHLNYFLIFIGLGIASILAALFYTIGKKPYGYSGFGDIFVFIFFGIVGVFGSYFLYTKTLDWFILLPAAAVGFFSVAVLNLNNMRDIENDKASNKNTLVVKIGLKYAKIYQVVLLNLPFFLCLVYVMTKCKPNTFYQLFFLLLILIFAPIRRKILYITNPKDFDPFLKQVSLLTLLFVLLFGIGINYGEFYRLNF